MGGGRMITRIGMATAGQTGPQECAGCGKKIHDKFILKAVDQYWHENCLKCGCCDCRLGEVGQSLYTKGNLLLCKRDYLRLFGSTGYCAACRKVIPAFEMVMRARANVYHLECFACQQCGHRFCVGDHFYLRDNQVLCGPDYEERMVFASLSSHPNQLAQLRHGGSGGHQHPSNPQLQNQNGPSSSLPPVSCLTSSSSPAAARQRTPLPPISSVRSSLLQT